MLVCVGACVNEKRFLKWIGFNKRGHRNPDSHNHTSLIWYAKFKDYQIWVLWFATVRTVSLDLQYLYSNVEIEIVNGPEN